MNIHEWQGDEIPPDVIQQAVIWIAMLDGLEEDAKDTDKRKQFYCWLNEDPIHQQAFAELSEIWAKIACLEVVREKIDVSQVLSFPHNDNRAAPKAHQFEQPILSDELSSPATYSPDWLYKTTLAVVVFGLFLSLVI